ncbi:hypothetical protein JW859_07060 [bacterium]|nr:hypothetical protein [bacterium]
MRTRLLLLALVVVTILVGWIVSCCCTGALDSDEIAMNTPGTGGDGTGDDGTGDDGTGDDGLREAAAYFPSELGVTYTYRPITLVDPIHGAMDDLVYQTIASPQGTGFAFEAVGADVSSPVFDGLSFLGTANHGDGAWSATWVDVEGRSFQVLPATLTGVGQTWQAVQRFHQFESINEADVWFPLIQADFEIAAVEDIEVQGVTYEDSLRIDGAVNWAYLGWGDDVDVRYWLAPDVGLVRAEARLASVLIGQLDLASRE